MTEVISIYGVRILVTDGVKRGDLYVIRRVDQFREWQMSPTPVTFEFSADEILVYSIRRIIIILK